MIEINEVQEVLKTLKQIPIEENQEQFERNYNFGINLLRESNYKATMSGIRAKDCYVDSSFK